MKKALVLLLAMAIPFASGCSLLKASSRKTSKKDMTPYDYKTAEDYANDWCGPCEEIKVRTITAADDSEVEIHYMRDKEYGFEYQIDVRYYEYATKIKPEPSYNCEDFDYYYLQEYLAGDPLGDLVDKYQLTIELRELEESEYSKGLYLLYSPAIYFTTDLELTEEERDEILEKTYYSLLEFDDREHFTANEYCRSVYLEVRCAPSERDQELGRLFGSSTGRVGYKYD